MPGGSDILRLAVGRSADGGRGGPCGYNQDMTRNRLPMRALFALLVIALAAAPARAQEEGDSSPMPQEPPSAAEPDGDNIPTSTLPASDSPESSSSSRAIRPQWQGGKKKVQTFLVPLDEKARAATARVAQALEQLQGSLPQYEVVDLGRALKSDAAPEQARHAAEGRKLVAEANLLLAARGYADAVGTYKQALKELEKGLPALEGREYADVWARLAAAQALSGDDKASRVSFVNAARHDPEGKLTVRSIDTSAEARLAGGRADVEALPSGVLEVESRPGGAKVMVDGEAKGAAPMRLELTSGKHLVRIERAGYFPSAELVDVPAGRELVHTAQLKGTPRAADLYETMSAAAEEAGRGQVGAGSTRLAEKFGLDRLFVGSVASHGAKVALTLSLVDVQKRRQVAKVDLLLAADGTDADQLEDETRRAGKKLSLQDGGDAVSSDPHWNEPTRTAAAPDSAWRGPAAQAASDLDGPAARPAPSPTSPRATAIPSDEADLATRERRPAPPAQTASSASPAAPTEEQPAPVVKPDSGAMKKRPKKLKEKTGQEDW